MRQAQQEVVPDAMYERDYQQLKQLTDYVIHFQSDAGQSAV